MINFPFFSNSSLLFFTLEAFKNIWNLVTEMAPYLLLGFLISGVLHLLIHPRWIKSVLGKYSFKSVLKACLIGIPIPLCSCSVIPVTASLKRNGASPGATIAFLTSTPQTGIDSIMATYSLLGYGFAFFRVIIALVSGLLTGLLIDLFFRKTASSDQVKFKLEREKSCCGSTHKYSKAESNQLFSEKPVTKSNLMDRNENPFCYSSNRGFKNGWFMVAIKYGFFSLVKDIAKPLLLGLLIASFISILIPSNSLSEVITEDYYLFPFVTLLSLPLYICSTASVPMAFALVEAGFSPGSILIFLILGPATNTTTLVTTLKLIGSKATIIYVATLLGVSWLAALVFEKWININPTVPFHDCSEEPGIMRQVSAFILILLLIYGWIRGFYKSSQTD